MKRTVKQSPASPEPRISKPLLKLFAGYSRHYLRRNFHSIRVSIDSRTPSSDGARPIVIYLNHASWWDPLVCLYLARKWFADRTSLAPIESGMLKQYAFFKHLGFYPVNPGTGRGALEFLRTTADLLRSNRNMLWLTPQGRFADSRERPVPFRRGLGALATRLPGALFVPLAIDYTFWTEPQSEILLSFGEGVVPEQMILSNISDWTDYFAAALERTQDGLAEKAMRRNSFDWEILERGASGVHAIYDGWRSMRSRVTGTNFTAEHQSEETESQ